MTIVEAMKASKDGRIRRRYWRQGDYIKDQDGRSGFTASWTDRNAHLTSDNLCFEDWEPYVDLSEILDRTFGDIKLVRYVYGPVPSDDSPILVPITFKDVLLRIRMVCSKEERALLSTYLLDINGGD